MRTIFKGNVRFIVAVVVAVLAVQAIGLASDVFTDVDDANIFHDDIAWLAANGITLGCNPPANDEFCPKGYVTREQMAAMLHRFAESVGVTGPTGPKGPKGDPGTPGVDGADGADGANGASGWFTNYVTSATHEYGRVVDVDCAFARSRVVGGGVLLLPHDGDANTHPQDIVIAESGPIDEDTWRATVMPSGANDHEWTVRAYAICLAV